MTTCDPMKCNPICLRCGDTPSCGDGSWSWMDGVHRHRCRDLHPQCGHDRVPCEHHQPGELIALLREEVKALLIVRNTKNAEVDRLVKHRHALWKALRDVVQAIKDEPELPGPMPDEMWQMLNGNRDMTQLAMVRAVQATKEGIMQRVNANPIAAGVLKGVE